MPVETLGSKHRSCGHQVAIDVEVMDEGQWTCHPDDAEKLAALMSRCVELAGKRLEMHCPLASDALIGKSWYNTH